MEIDLKSIDVKASGGSNPSLPEKLSRNQTLINHNGKVAGSSPVRTIAVR